MTTGLNPLEDIISHGFLQVVGDPLFLGLILVGFFGALVFIQNSKLDGKLVVFVPAFLLALYFLPSWLALMFALAMGVILYMAFTKFTNR